ncbi:unnamed protein product [Ambrosiozyma monospora]|uniref:Complex III subunit 9 n=1 Tax=Ambrosiozyma monospora TaxID=43982 RepID=A0A9W6SZW0_AMBMO|nr:unnamed protein product [Ambrosiozyma monospora]
MSYGTIVNTFFKRNAVFVTSVFTAAFVFQPIFDDSVSNWYYARNKGKLWQDVKLKLAAGGDDDEEDDE